jgi:hypothetical protein
MGGETQGKKERVGKQAIDLTELVTEERMSLVEGHAG